MSKTEIITKIEALNDWMELIEDAQEQAEALRDAIKQEMLREDAEELSAGQYIVRWTPVTRNTFDSATFKREMPDVYKAFIKQTTARRFSISD